MNVDRVRKGFDLISPFYDLSVHLFFGSSLSQAQVHFLPKLEKATSVLIFGGGTGRILVDCLRFNSTAHYHYVDISSKMIAKARKRIKPNENITFHNCSYQDIPDSFKVNTIVTPFVLDCFSEEELEGVMRKLHSHLKPKGNWLMTDFNHEKNDKWMIRLLYWFFIKVCGIDATQLPKFKYHFVKRGLKMVSEKRFGNGLLVTQLYTDPTPN